MKQWMEFESTNKDCDKKTIRVFVNDEYASLCVVGSNLYADFDHKEMRSVCEQILSVLDRYKDEGNDEYV